MAMSLRSRGGAGAARRGRAGVRSVYEDFKPMSEWKHEGEADILLYHLPGFVKEQIRILAESKRVLRVRGERFIRDNKWSRFEEEVMVPEDCNMSEIRAKFEGGILRIIMPRKIKMTPKEPTMPERTNVGTPSPTESPTKLGYDQTDNKPDPIKATPANPAPTDRGQPTATHDHEPPRPSTPKPDLHTKPQQTQEQASSPRAAKRAQTMEEERQYNEAYDHHEKAEGVEDRSQDEIYEQKKERNEVEYHKRATNRSQLPWSLEEDRQLLVNMGVAVLVIVGLGAYISYSFGSST